VIGLGTSEFGWASGNWRARGSLQARSNRIVGETKIYTELGAVVT
jgi:hypothetical protein